MSRGELLINLKNRYSFEKSLSIINYAAENGIYEDDKAIVIATKEKSNSEYTVNSYWFDLEWKK